MYVFMYVCMYVSIYVCMYVSMYVSMYVCMYVCMYLWLICIRKRDTNPVDQLVQILSGFVSFSLYV